MTSQASDARTRFRAVGMLGGAAGAVVLPPMPADVADAIDRGNFEALPDPWNLLSTLAAGGLPSTDPGDPLGPLLIGDGPGLAALSHAAGAAGDRDLEALLAAAAYRMGAAIDLPQPAGDLDPRVRAFVQATHGHEAAAEGDADRALDLLLGAAAAVAPASPAAAARLVGEAATLAGPGRAPRLAHELDRAAGSLEGLAFEELRGELLMSRGGLLMELGSARPALLQEAVRCFQKATQALPRQTHPVPYALCHLNVAVAYLAMPMGQHASRLRAAIAVQSLREALDVFDPEEHPDLWQAATLNLANALQHLPSSHVKDNLVEAVRHYETLLSLRTRPDAGRARVLANLGNALAHLGERKGARARLDEAREIFAALGDRDALSGIDDIVAELDQSTGEPAAGSVSQAGARDSTPSPPPSGTDS